MRQLLSGGRLLDGKAFVHLCARGFLPLLGCRPQGAVDGPSVERLDRNDFAGAFAGQLLPTYWYRAKPEEELPLRLLPKPASGSGAGQHLPGRPQCL